jgi:hypothetical protein
MELDEAYDAAARIITLQTSAGRAVIEMAVDAALPHILKALASEALEQDALDTYRWLQAKAKAVP